MNEIKKDVPLNKIAKPEEIVPYIVFLSSHHNHYMVKIV